MAPQAARGQMPAGYEGYAAFRASVDRLAASDRVAASVLAKTAGGRDVVLLTVGAGEPDTKPAVLVVGGVEAGDLVGSHLAMMIAEQLAAAPDAGASLLEDVTFYIIPRPSPDAAERLFEAPVVASHANTRPTDDDRDGATDEDPPEDLNGDGLITAMRVADEAGQYMPHPDEPRLLVKADPTKGERGVYRLLTEGVDNDGDERWNEDGPGGVDFNRNFTYRYPFFKPGAGPHQVSEPETRGVADFAYDHPNIFLVLSLAPQDNLNHTPKPERAAGRIRRGVQGSDAAYLKALAKRYADATGAKDAPKPAEGPGAFVPWAYHHYGRWSIAARPWWPPKPAEKKLDEKKPDEKKPEKKPAEGEQSEEVPEASGEPTAGDAAAKDREAGKAKKKQPDPRAAADRKRLAWLDAEGIDGHAAWTEVEHPDFPGKRVEVGGFKPGLAYHPPVDRLDAAPLVELLRGIAEDRARPDVITAEAQALGAGVTRVTARVINRGGLPTVSEMGAAARQLRRFQIELRGPEGIQALDGPLRQDVGVLAPGQVAERTWLVRLPESTGLGDLRLRAGEPSIGFAESEVSPAAAAPTEEQK